MKLFHIFPRLPLSLIMIVMIPLFWHCAGSFPKAENSDIREVISGDAEACYLWYCDMSELDQTTFSSDMYFRKDGALDIYFIGQRDEVRRWVITTDSQGRESIAKSDFHGPHFKQVNLLRKDGSYRESSIEVFGTGTGNTPVLFRRNSPSQGQTDYAEIGMPPSSGLKSPRATVPGYYVRHSEALDDALVSGWIGPDYTAYIVARKLGTDGLKDKVNDGSSLQGVGNLFKADGSRLKVDYLAMANRPEANDNKGWVLAVERSTGNYFLYRCTDVTCDLQNQDPFLTQATAAIGIEDPGSGDLGVDIRIVDRKGNLYHMQRGADGIFQPAVRIDKGVKATVSVRRNPFDQSIHAFYYKGNSLYDHRDPNGCALLGCIMPKSEGRKIISARYDIEEEKVTAADLRRKEKKKTFILAPYVTGSGLDRNGAPMPGSLAQFFTRMGEGEIRFTSLPGGSQAEALPDYADDLLRVFVPRSPTPQNDDDPDNREKIWQDFLRSQNLEEVLPPDLATIVYSYLGNLPIQQYLRIFGEAYLGHPVPHQYLEEGSSDFHWGYFQWQMDQQAWGPMAQEFMNGWGRTIRGVQQQIDPRRTIFVMVPINHATPADEQFRRAVIYHEVFRALQDSLHPFQQPRNNGYYGVPVFDIAIISQGRERFLAVQGEVRVAPMVVTNENINHPWSVPVGPFTMEAMTSRGTGRALTVNELFDVLSVNEEMSQMGMEGYNGLQTPRVRFRGSLWGEAEGGILHESLFRIFILANYYSWQMAVRDHLTPGNILVRRQINYLDHRSRGQRSFYYSFPEWGGRYGWGASESVDIFPPAWVATESLALYSLISRRPSSWVQMGAIHNRLADFLDTDSNLIYTISYLDTGAMKIMAKRKVAAASSVRSASSAKGVAYAEGKDAQEGKTQAGAGPRYQGGEDYARSQITLPLLVQPNRTEVAVDTMRGYTYTFRVRADGRLEVTDVRRGNHVAYSCSSSSSSSSGSRLQSADPVFFPSSSCANGDGERDSVTDFTADQTFRISESGHPSYYPAMVGESGEREFVLDLGANESRRELLQSLQFYGRPSVVIRGDDVYLWYLAKDADGFSHILGGKASLVDLIASQGNALTESASLRLDWAAEERPYAAGNQVANLVSSDQQWLAYCGYQPGSNSKKLFLFNRSNFSGGWLPYLKNNNDYKDCDGPVAISSFDEVMHLYAVHEGEIHHFQMHNDALKFRGDVGSFSGDYLYARSDADGYEVLTTDLRDCDYDCRRYLVFRNSLDVQTLVSGDSKFQFELRPDGQIYLQRYVNDQPVGAAEKLSIAAGGVGNWFQQFSVTAVSAEEADKMNLVLVTAAAEQSANTDNIRFFKAKISRSAAIRISRHYTNVETPEFSEMTGTQATPQGSISGFSWQADPHGLNQLSLRSNRQHFAERRRSNAQLLFTGEDGQVRSAVINFQYNGNGNDLQADFRWVDQGAVVRTDDSGNMIPLENSGSARLQFSAGASESYFAFGKTEKYYGSLWEQVPEGERPVCTDASDSLCGYSSAGVLSYNLVRPLMSFAAPDWQANFSVHDNEDLHAFAPFSRGTLYSFHLPREESGPGALPITEELSAGGTFSCFDSVIDVSHVDSSCLGGGFEPMLVSNSTTLPNP